MIKSFHGSGAPPRHAAHLAARHDRRSRARRRAVPAAQLNTILPFTRNAISSMDFTPVIFSPYNRDTTRAHEVATSIVFESGWQHLADNPKLRRPRGDAHPQPDPDDLGRDQAARRPPRPGGVLRPP